MTANSSRHADGGTPLELIAGDTPGVSEHLDSGFHDFVQHQSNGGLDTSGSGGWLGVSHQVGKLMSHWIPPQSGIPMSVTRVQRATNLEKKTDEIQKRMDDFQLLVQSGWDARTSAVESPPTDEQNVLSLEKRDEEFIQEFNRVIESEDLTDNEPIKLGPDDLLNVEVGFNLKEHGFRQGEVEKRAVNADGTPTGTANNSVLLDSWACEVEFSDGQTKILTANIVAENSLAEVDPEGNGFLFVEDSIESDSFGKQ